MTTYKNQNMMKRIFLLSVCALLCSLCSRADNDKPADPSYTFAYNGTQRVYYLHKPANLPADAPVVVVLHGYGGHAKDGGMAATADKYGFAVCYPEGTMYRDRQSWNVGYSNQKGMEADDVDFLAKLLDELHARHGLSLANAFLTGYSNGGDMCYLVASQQPGLFAAYASNCGQLQTWIYRKDDRRKPVAFAEFHCTLDRISMWDGDPYDKGNWGEYVAVPAAVRYMAGRNRCLIEQTDTAEWHIEGKYTTLRHRYTDALEGKDVYLYEILGGAHGVPWCKPEVNEEIWKFFARYKRN